MPKEWSSFKITLVLYLLVLILPLSFNFVYTSFKTIKNDTKIVHQLGWTGVSIAYISLNPNDSNTDKKIQHLDNTFKEISNWVIKNDTSGLYVGADSLSQDFIQLQTCWNEYKQMIHDSNTVTMNNKVLKCLDRSSYFATVVEKMVYLKQKKMINLFYFSLTIAMILILITIYLVRTYIHIQMKKHAIHDHETHLFNKKYFLSELHSTFSRSIRHKNPLSLLFVSLNDFTEKTYDKKTKINIMKQLGEIFTTVTRISDIPCRYDENHFAVLLPLTDKEHALILEDRLREALEEHDFKVSPEIDFSFATTQADPEESEETFIGRTQKELSL